MNTKPDIETFDSLWRALIRLRWQMRFVALVAVGLWALYGILIIRRPFSQVVVDLFWGALLSLILIQICFNVVFRLLKREVADRQDSAAHPLRLQQLHAINESLMAALQSGPSRSGTSDIKGDSLSMFQSKLEVALADLTAICDAQSATLLLVDEAGRPQHFVQVGGPADAQPGPQPDAIASEMAPTDLSSEPWVKFLMPGIEQVGSFVAVPVSAGECIRGYLALAGDKMDLSQDRALLDSFAATLSMILENASLVGDSRRQADEALTLAEVSRVISSQLTQEDLLPYLAESVARILDGTGSLIILRYPYTEELRLAATHGSYDEKDLSPPVIEGYLSFTRELMESGQSIVVEDVRGSVHFPQEIAERLRDKSLLGLPLMAQRQPIGAVIVGETRGRRRFAAGEVGRATVVANQGAVAIANARLFHEVEQRLVELGTLAEIARVILSPLQVSEIYQRIVDELARAFGYPFVAVYQTTGDGLELGAKVGYEERHLPMNIPLGHGFIGKAAVTGQTEYVPDTGALIDTKVAVEGVVSQIALPLRNNGQVLGVLVVETFDPLMEADLALLQSLGYQVTTAVENARLYAAEQREREVARTLLQIAGDLGGTLHLDEVLALILERLQAVVPYESAAIGLLAGGVCSVAATRGMPRGQQLWEEVFSRADSPLIARVLEGCEAVIVADTRQSNEWQVIPGAQDVRSWLGVPLVVQDGTIGLLMLSHVTPGFYDQESTQVALAFAQHAALAIDNARLYEQAQATLREQTLLHEMTTAVSSTLDAGQVLRLLAERLVTVLGVTSARIAILGDEVQTANLVAEHCSDEANAAEWVGSVGEVYKLNAFPVTASKLKEREPLLVTVGDGPQEWQPVMRQRAGQAMLLLPLVARDRVTGFVELWDGRSPRRFTEAEIALAQTLINPAAVAIDNARLFAETQRSISEMMLLYDIAVAAASTLELDTVLQSVVKTLQFRVLEKSVVNVWLIDSVEGILRLRAHAGELEGLGQKETLQLDEGLCGKVVQTAQPILVGDAGQDPEHTDYGPPVRSILCVPLAWGQRVVGVLQALSRQPGAFSSNELRLLRTMAGSLAIAVENVHLFGQLKRSEEALVLRNRALKRANDRLQELDRLKSSFIASVSHELRTPLNSIIGFSEVMLDGLAGDLEPVPREYLGYIHDSGKHLLDLINDILDLSRIQAGRMTLKLDQVDVMSVLEEVRATVAPLVTKKQQVFSIEQLEPVPTIIADRLRLKQILLNLLSNACKYTQDRGQIKVHAHMADAATLRIDVIDNGPGISLEDQVVIFQEFRQARVALPGEGTGLGLAITRRLVDFHGGRVWVESELGAGATFTVLFPITGPEPEAEDQGEEDEGG